MAAFSFIFLMILVLVAAPTMISGQRNLKTAELERRLEEKIVASNGVLANAAPPQPTPTPAGRVFYPTRYGADPTGQRDSWAGILQALNEATKMGNGLRLLPGVKDLGGAVIDLQGGNYLISQPIRFPSNIGNLVFQSGTVRAMNQFPNTRYLVELQSDQPPKQTPYEDITFRDILFDSRNRSGGLLIDSSARTRVTNCFFLHFSTKGIAVRGGHETFVSNCFLGHKSTTGSDPDERYFKGTAIDLSGNDNAITDVAIFSAAVGIAVGGQANMITGVHCYNKATYFGGVGIAVNLPGLSQTRIDNCYMDYTSIVLQDPVQVVVSNVFFLGDANIVLRSVKGVISGLTIVNNLFSGKQKRTVELQGPAFSSIDQVLIDGNNVNGGMSLRSTVARARVAVNGTIWVADFSSALVFPNRIAQFQYSFYANQAVGKVNFPVHAVTNTANNVVVIQSDRVAQGVVSVEVRQ